ncbi:MAG: DUF4443 domain-containing protein [Candidatus Methanomethylophilaceae archaeon]
MRIINMPQYGPMFRFTDANVYWALYLLSDGKRMGRKKLADAVGVGEGSMRRILDTLREWEMISIKQTGITITRSGLGFLGELPIKIVDIDMGDAVVGEFNQAVLVYGVANKIENGMQQRDAGIKVGAEGCTTVVMRNGVLMIPPDWNVDKERPELARKIRTVTEMTNEDVLIVGSSSNRYAAVVAALTAAFELF